MWENIREKVDPYYLFKEGLIKSELKQKSISAYVQVRLYSEIHMLTYKYFYIYVIFVLMSRRMDKALLVLSINVLQK